MQKQKIMGWTFHLMLVILCPFSHGCQLTWIEHGHWEWEPRPGRQCLANKRPQTPKTCLACWSHPCSRNNQICTPAFFSPKVKTWTVTPYSPEFSGSIHFLCIGHLKLRPVSCELQLHGLWKVWRGLKDTERDWSAILIAVPVSGWVSQRDVSVCRQNQTLSISILHGVIEVVSLLSNSV